MFNTEKSYVTDRQDKRYIDTLIHTESSILGQTCFIYCSVLYVSAHLHRSNDIFPSFLPNAPPHHIHVDAINKRRWWLFVSRYQLDYAPLPPNVLMNFLFLDLIIRLLTRSSISGRRRFIIFRFTFSRQDCLFG